MAAVQAVTKRDGGLSTARRKAKSLGRSVSTRRRAPPDNTTSNGSRVKFRPDGWHSDATQRGEKRAKYPVPKNMSRRSRSSSSKPVLPTIRTPSEDSETTRHYSDYPDVVPDTRGIVTSLEQSFEALDDPKKYASPEATRSSRVGSPSGKP